MKELSITCLLLLLSSTLSLSQKTEKEEKEFIEVYGNHCGLYGNDPKLRVELDSLISIKDWATIENWISSETLTKRVYSFEAIISIEELAQSISDKTEVYMNKIRKNRKKVLTCNGCNYEYERVKNIIKKIED